MKFETELEKSKQWSMSTLIGKTAKDWQKCVRAEAAAVDGQAWCMFDGEFVQRVSHVGHCVCVTCGKRHPWNTNLMDAGHFLAGRSNSILFEPTNIHPQCKWCNRTGGRPQEYRKFMLSAYGQQVVDGLEVLKRQTRSFTREELVTKRREFRARTKAAIARMKQ